jgi:hypothetical protein
MFFQKVADESGNLGGLFDEWNMPAILHFCIDRSRNVILDHLGEKRRDEIIIVASQYECRTSDVFQARGKNWFALLTGQLATPP